MLISSILEIKKVSSKLMFMPESRKAGIKHQVKQRIAYEYFRKDPLGGQAPER